MEKRSVKRMFAHWDFMIVDLLCLESSYLLAVFVENGFLVLCEKSVYRDMIVVFLLADILMMSGYEIFTNVLKRDFGSEWAVTVKHVGLVMLVGTFFLYITQTGDGYSRRVIVQTGIQYLVAGYVGRMIWKRHLLSRNREGISGFHERLGNRCVGGGDDTKREQG